MVSHNFGKMKFSPEVIDNNGTPVNILALKDANGRDWFDLAEEYKFPWYIAIADDGIIYSMEDDYQSSQIEGTIVGITSTYGYTNGENGTVYGMMWDGQAIVPPPVVVTVPNSVSRFQARAALYNAGLLSAVEDAIGGADELVKMAWADAQEFRRNSPTILAMAAMLELTAEQVDDLFIAAAQIIA